MILPYIRPPYASTMHEYDHALSDFREKAWRASKSKQLSCTHWFFFGPMPIAVVACFLAVVEIVSCPYRSIKLIGCASRQPATWLRLGYRMCECEVAYNIIQPRIRWVKHGESMWSIVKLVIATSMARLLRSPAIAEVLGLLCGWQLLLGESESTDLPSFMFISNFGALSPWMCNDSYCCQKAFFPKVLITCDHTARTVFCFGCCFHIKFRLPLIYDSLVA